MYKVASKYFSSKIYLCALYLLFYNIAEWETDDCNTRLISLLNCPIDLIAELTCARKEHARGRSPIAK